MTSISRPGGTTIFFRESGANIQYSINNQASWISFGNVFPVTLTNSNTLAGVLKIEFVTDIVFNNVNMYFACGSTDIQYGSSSLKGDGTRPIITIDVDNYEGLIQNGDTINPGYNNIYVYNLVVDGTGRTVQTNGGWIGKIGFGNGSTDNYIVNCSSLGDLPGGGNGSGGIVGSYGGINGSLVIIGCSSSGLIGNGDGGIVGGYAGYNGGSVVCQSCWSTGVISTNGGGIFGKSAGDSGYAEASDCYSSGLITSSGGGIYGILPGDSGQAIAQRCYSEGLIGTDAGGIFGSSAASNGGITNAANCYSAGTITSPGNGIYGRNKQAGGIQSNCYSADGNWSKSTANTQLTGVPISSKVGTSWVETVTNQPYELRNMGFSPYTTGNIVGGSTPSLNTNFEQVVDVAAQTNAAIISNKSYTILEITPSESTITIDSVTGRISTTWSTPVNNYSIVIRNDGSYNFSIFSLSVIYPLPCLTKETTVLTPKGYVNVTELKRGDIVCTSDKRRVKIVDLMKTVVPGSKETYPCKIPKDSIAVGYPSKDFKISQCHLIKWREYWLLPKKCFKLDSEYKTIEYYHIQLPDYTRDHLVINDGVVVESLGKTHADSMEYRKRITNTLIFYSMNKGPEYIKVNNLLNESIVRNRAEHLQQIK